jgi:hypothetical protein
VVGLRAWALLSKTLGRAERQIGTKPSRLRCCDVILRGPVPPKLNVQRQAEGSRPRGGHRGPMPPAAGFARRVRALERSTSTGELRISARG